MNLGVLGILFYPLQGYVLDARRIEEELSLRLIFDSGVAQISLRFFGYVAIHTQIVIEVLHRRRELWLIFFRNVLHMGCLHGSFEERFVFYPTVMHR